MSSRPGNPPLRVLEPVRRRRRREVDVVVAFVLMLAGVGLLTLAGGLVVLVVLVVRGL